MQVTCLSVGANANGKCVNPFFLYSDKGKRVGLNWHSRLGRAISLVEKQLWKEKPVEMPTKTTNLSLLTTVIMIYNLLILKTRTIS